MTPERTSKPESTRSNLFACPPVRSFRVIVGVCLAFLLLMTAEANRGLADEFSILRNSTVLGRNYGLPPVIRLDREILVNRACFRQLQPGDLSLITEVDFIAKNLELTGSPNIDGETFFGVVAPLRLSYLASDQVQIEVGGYFGRNYGDDDSLDISEPLARLIYEPRDSMYGIVGSLIQTHWIHDGLRDDVFTFRDNQETGLQFRADRPRWKADYWIDWRVRETDQRSEQFDGALANQFRIGQLWLDGQFFWSHTGGQLNAMNQVINSSTVMLGASYGWGPQSEYGNPLRIGVSYLGSEFEERGMPTTTGTGIEYWVFSDISFCRDQTLRLFGKHFEGSNFYAQRGDPLYRFDQYSQVGFDWVKTVEGGLDLEFGFVGQFADDTFMNTFQINLAWQYGFWLNNTQCYDEIAFESLPEAVEQ